jgi:hypothetical protein
VLSAVIDPKGGVITTATLRDATDWDQMVIDLALAGLVRHGLRHTALTWMADSGSRSTCCSGSPGTRIRPSSRGICTRIRPP